MKINNDDIIRTIYSLKCYLCGNLGKLLYRGLKDRLFGAPGVWNLKRCPNPECGLVWLNPMPLVEDIHKTYQCYHTHESQTSDNWKFQKIRYFKNNMFKEGYLSIKYGYRFNGITSWKKFVSLLAYFRPIHRAKLDLNVMMQGFKPQGHLLDVGCGNGWLLQEMSKIGWQAEGLDPDPLAVEQAQKSGLKVQLGTLEERHYPNEQFHLVTMSHIIEHVHDPVKILRECQRILKTGGKAVIITPNIKSLGHRIFKDSWRPLEPPRHLFIFSTSALSHLAERAGFKKIRIRTTIRSAKFVFLESRALQRHGAYKAEKLPALATWLWGNAMALGEWGFSLAEPDVGEEIVAVLEK